MEREPQSRDEFNRDAIAAIAESGHCRGCPLAGHVRVGMDTWSGLAQPCQVLFMGLNPGREEAERGLPFVGRAGRFLRECIDESGMGRAAWAMINSMLCSTNNEREIPDIPLCRSQCRPNVARFALRLKPHVIVPCGNGAAGLFGLGSGITANAKLTFISTGRSGRAEPTLVMPITHPSSLIRNGGKNAANFSGFMERLDEIAQTAARFDRHKEDYGLAFRPRELFMA